MLRLTAVALAALSISLTSPAEAAYTINVTEVGNDVVASGSGSFNTAAITVNPFGSSFGSPFINGNAGITIGVSGPVDRYNFAVGPAAFGSFLNSSASSSTGATVGRFSNILFVPLGYISGTELGVSTATFGNATLASLGLNPGSYTYNLQATVGGATVDTFTINIAASVPEPATWAMMLLGFGAIGFSMRGRRKELGIAQLA